MKWALAWLLTGCVPAMQGSDLAGYAGVAFCTGRNQSVAFINVDVLSTSDLITVPPHEAKHREQFTRFPSCKAVRRHYRTGTGRMQMEAEAYAAGYCAGVKAGLPIRDTYEDMEARLTHYMKGWMPEILVRATFAHYAERC